MRPEVVDAEDWFMLVNGPNFPIRDSRPQLVEWAKTTLQTIDQLPDPPFRPDLLHHNPLYVWGGAVMDDFFTEAEFPQAVAFIESRYGRIPTHVHAFEFTMQCGAIADLLSTFLKESKVERFQRFCAAAGIYFQVRPPRFQQVDDDADDQAAPSVPARPSSPSLFQRVRNLFRR